MLKIVSTAAEVITFFENANQIRISTATRESLAIGGTQFLLDLLEFDIKGVRYMTKNLQRPDRGRTTNPTFILITKAKI